MKKELKLVYDVKSVPNGLSISDFAKIVEQHSIVFWDSSKNATKPRFYKGDNPESVDLLLVDTAGKEIDIERFQRDFEETEKWDKELHRCKNSAPYFFTHYGATSYPVTQSMIGEYLKSIGLAQIEMTDSDKAEEAWAAQKEKATEAMKHIDIPFLKERGKAMEIMKGLYEEEMTKLEDALKDSVKLFDKKGLPLAEPQRVQNLVGRIKGCTPVPPEYTSYRNKKGNWDHAMLIATSYTVLLNMYKAIKK